MKRTASLAALVLAAMMFLALAGCSPAAPTATPAAPATEAPAATAAVEATPEPLPAVKLTWYMMIGGAQRDQDEVFAEFSKYVQSKINAEVSIVPLEWGTYDQKLQTAAAAGEEFDVTWISDWSGVKYAEFANKGAIIPLDDLIAQYAPETKAFVADKFWDKMKINGKIYGVPCYQMFYRQNGMWVKKDLADKYKFDPKAFQSYKDLEPFYDAILAGETDVVPIAANGGYVWWFSGSTGPAPDRGPMKQLGYGINVYASDPTKMIDETKESPAVDDFKASLALARDWYLKKYVRQDLLSIQDNDAEIKTQRYASGFMMLAPDSETTFTDKYGFEAYMIPLGKPVLSGVTATEMAISVTSKNPERAMMFIELLMNDKFAYNLIANGIEGKHYVKAGENRISRVESNGYQPGMNWALGNTFLGYLVPGQPDNIFEVTKQFNDNAEPAFMPDWNFNNEKVKNECAATDPLWNEYGNPLFAGVLDPETKYPEYMDKVAKAGHDAIAAEIKAQFEAYLASHK